MLFLSKIMRMTSFDLIDTLHNILKSFVVNSVGLRPTLLYGFSTRYIRTGRCHFSVFAQTEGPVRVLLKQGE